MQPKEGPSIRVLTDGTLLDRHLAGLQYAAIQQRGRIQGLKLTRSKSGGPRSSS